MTESVSLSTGSSSRSNVIRIVVSFFFPQISVCPFFTCVVDLNLAVQKVFFYIKFYMDCLKFNTLISAKCTHNQNSHSGQPYDLTYKAHIFPFIFCSIRILNLSDFFHQCLHILFFFLNFDRE